MCTALKDNIKYLPYKNVIEIGKAGFIKSCL